jgi:hypothetical protein
VIRSDQNFVTGHGVGRLLGRVFRECVAGMTDLMLDEVETDFRAGVANDLMEGDSEGVAGGTAQAEVQAFGIDEMRGGVELGLREEVLVKRELNLDGKVLFRRTGFRELPESDDGVFEEGGEEDGRTWSGCECFLFLEKLESESGEFLRKRWKLFSGGREFFEADIRPGNFSHSKNSRPGWKF